MVKAPFRGSFILPQKLLSFTVNYSNIQGTQKRQGYNLEHRYSHNYQATKNHYYLIQIGHMVAQIIEGWKKIWEGIQQSREQKHRRMLENFKMVDLKEYKEEIQEQCQIRFE